MGRERGRDDALRKGPRPHPTHVVFCMLHALVARPRRVATATVTLPRYTQRQRRTARLALRVARTPRLHVAPSTPSTARVDNHAVRRSPAARRRPAEAAPGWLFRRCYRSHCRPPRRWPQGADRGGEHAECWVSVGPHNSRGRARGGARPCATFHWHGAHSRLAQCNSSLFAASVRWLNSADGADTRAILQRPTPIGTRLPPAHPSHAPPGPPLACSTTARKSVIGLRTLVGKASGARMASTGEDSRARVG